MKHLFLFAFFALCTLPGFAQWTKLNSGTTATLSDIFFTDANTGYTGGKGGVLLKTTNGGTTWTALPAFTSKDISEIHFTDAANGWVNLQEGGLYKTTNGGQTFTDMRPLFGILPAGYQLKASSINLKGPVVIVGGFFADSPQTVPGLSVWKKTIDGGQTWASWNPPAQYAYSTAIRILDSDTIFIAPFGTLIQTTNGGNTWDTLCSTGTCFSFPPLNTKCFQMFDGAGTGLASMQYHFEYGVFTPAAGNVSFQHIKQPDSSSLDGVFSMSFPKGKTGYLLKFGFRVGADPYELLKTKDGGYTFEKLTLPDSFSAGNMQFVSEELGYTCGLNGAIYKTTNGGGTLAVSNPEKAEEDILVFPNPATTFFTISQSALPFSAAELFSMGGRKVKAIAAGTTTVNIQGLPAGQYLLLLHKGSASHKLKVEIAAP